MTPYPDGLLPLGGYAHLRTQGPPAIRLKLRADGGAPPDSAHLGDKGVTGRYLRLKLVEVSDPHFSLAYTRHNS